MAPGNQPAALEVLEDKSKRKRPAASSFENHEPPEKRVKKAPGFSSPSETVIFHIGKEGEEEPFTVHKEFACYYSPVLDAAFNGNFEEGRSQTYHLEDIGPSDFRLLVQWLYTQKLDTERDFNSSLDRPIDPETEKLRIAQDLDLIQLWVVADRLLIRSLQNHVIRELSSLWGHDGPRFPTTKWIAYAYEHTSPGSPLRMLTVDVCAYLLDFEDVKDSQDFPHEMLFDLATTMSIAVTPLRPGRSDHGDSYQDPGFGIIDEKWKDTNPGPEELFFNGDKFSCARLVRNYLVPEDN